MTLLAAIGIVCRSNNSLWHPLPPDSESTLFRAVVRVSLSTEIANETTDRFVYFGRVPHAVTQNPRINGGSWSTFAWFRFASRRWNATFLGHGEDDALVDLPRLKEALDIGRRLVEQGTAAVALGSIESFHWDTNRSESHFFWSRLLSRYDCEWRNMSGAYKGGKRWHLPSDHGTIIGPFPFLKGELFLWSAHLVDTVLCKTPFLQEEGRRHMSRKYGTAPWDDVFAGAVASHAPVSDLVYVHRTLAHHKQRSAATIHPMHAEVAQRPRFIGKSCSGARLSIY